MGKCFIIQPFDGGKYDKRFTDIFSPAIISAGLEPYRVDQDINSIIPIDDIDNEIKNATICLADISTDNPNIWFELGLAIAYGKDTIMICSEERKEKFPFDVQHRKIIKYLNESASDFEKLKSSIEERIKAYLKTNKNITEISKNVVQKTEGLDPNEIVTLVTIAENIDNPEDGVSIYTIKNEVEKAGYTKISSTLAITRLLSLKYIIYTTENDYNRQDYTAYHITEIGLQWLLDNKDKLILKIDNNGPPDFPPDMPF